MKTHRLIFYVKSATLVEVHGNGVRSILREQCSLVHAQDLAFDMELQLFIEPIEEAVL